MSAPKFGRRHYVVLAEAIRSARKDAESAPGVIPESWRVPIEFVENRIARYLAADNDRFNKTHFVAVAHGEKELASRPARSKQCGYCGENPNTAKHRASNCAAKTADLQGLSPEAWAAALEPECDCADRSWYGPGHDSACPLSNAEVL